MFCRLCLSASDRWDLPGVEGGRVLQATRTVESCLTEVLETIPDIWDDDGNHTPVRIALDNSIASCDAVSTF